MIRRIISLVGILCISTLLFTDANAKGKPDKPGKPDKTTAALIEFTGGLEGLQRVEGCCPDQGPYPAYTMRLLSACGDLAASEKKEAYEGYLYIGVWNAGGNPTAMVEFWIDGGKGFYLIGGDIIERDRKNKLLTVYFEDEPCWDHLNQIGDDPVAPTTTTSATFDLFISPPAD